MNLDRLCYSYHIFTFPFIWKRTGSKVQTFSEKVDLEKITLPAGSLWERNPPLNSMQEWRELYNERNYFYPFIHDALYDNAADDHIIRHFERKECLNDLNIYYVIKGAKRTEPLRLNVLSIGLNLYGTGVGTLSFYLLNDQYQKLDDIQFINDIGRRIAPPFLDLKSDLSGTKTGAVLIADYLALEGLDGNPQRFFEDFTGFSPNNSHWKAARFIDNLLEDFVKENALQIQPVTDDRMFVTCWIGLQELENKIRNNSRFFHSEQWYELAYLDKVNSVTCKNEGMRKNLLEQATNLRWQQNGTLYGGTRYSLICATGNGWFPKYILLPHMRTLYFRIAELCLVQRASVLCFSGEVTRISDLKEERTHLVAKDVRSLFKEYLRFVNKIYFREITAQDQGIEIYDLLQRQMRISEQVKNLETEIEELHAYVSLLEDVKKNEQVRWLGVIGAVFLAPTFITGFYGMNKFAGTTDETVLTNHASLMLFLSILAVMALSLGGGILTRKRNLRIFLLVTALLCFAGLIVFAFLK